MRSLLALPTAMLLAASALAGSETPPEGPPWHREFSKAQAQALREGKPIFVYLTKTH